MSTEISIRLVTTDADLRACWPVMQVLRPHLDEERFIAQVRRQQAQGYTLAALRDGNEVRSVTGYRFQETLAWGHILFVDDLVTATEAQGTGCGSQLFDWLVAQAREHGCKELHLESGVQRFGAHRFYLHKGMDITCHHFALRLFS